MTPLSVRLAERAQLGTFLKIPAPEVVDVLRLAGFDFVICDMEHAQIGETEARQLVRASATQDLPCVVRVPDLTPGLVNRLIEAGAAGIMQPRTQSASDSARLVQVTRFPPTGRRSVSTANPAGGYGTVSVADYVSGVDPAPLLVGQFETKDTEAPKTIMDGLDVAFIGPVDLAVDYGVPGQMDDPRVQEHIREVEVAALETATVLGAFAPSSEAARNLVDRGYRFVALAGDLTLLDKAARTFVSDFHAVLESGAPSRDVPPT